MVTVCYTSTWYFCLLQFFSASLLHLHENLTWVGPIDTHVFIWYFKLNLKQSLLLVNTDELKWNISFYEKVTTAYIDLL